MLSLSTYLHANIKSKYLFNATKSIMYRSDTRIAITMETTAILITLRFVNNTCIIVTDLFSKHNGNRNVEMIIFVMRVLCVVWMASWTVLTETSCFSRCDFKFSDNYYSKSFIFNNIQHFRCYIPDHVGENREMGREGCLVWAS